MNKSLNEYAIEIAKWRESKGFITPEHISDATGTLAKLMLVVSEVSEACEAIRDNDFFNFKEEIADTFIRLLDICGTMKIDIDTEIRTKMAKNEKRPYKHGRKI